MLEFPFVNGDDAKTYYYPDLRQLVLKDTLHQSDLQAKKFHVQQLSPIAAGHELSNARQARPSPTTCRRKSGNPSETEYPGSWSLDENGFEKMESGINARAIDFAKFGRLFLHNGNWDGVQVVPAEWVAELPHLGGYCPSIMSNYYYDRFHLRRRSGLLQAIRWRASSATSRITTSWRWADHGHFIHTSALQ